MHPKTNILPQPQSIARILTTGWVAQLKIHGHRAQIHISADPKEPILAFNRQGKRHSVEIPEGMASELRRLFTPKKDWNIIDAEWLKPKKKLFVFDFVKREGKLLRDMTFTERFKLLPRNFISPSISVLPLIQDLEGCLKALSGTQAHVEGLVFKSSTTRGFADTSIVRCRRKL